jgi:hypothetical protein
MGLEQRRRVRQTSKKTILGIFAPPDDKHMIGHVLAKYSKLGHNVT